MNEPDSVKPTHSLFGEIEAEIKARQARELEQSRAEMDSHSAHTMLMIISGADEVIRAARTSAAAEVFASPPPDPGADKKAFETLRARCALHGVQLYTIEADDGKPAYIVTKWAMTRQLASLAEVEALLKRIGGAEA